MAVDIRDHPDAPPTEELRDFTLVPVAREAIERKQEAGAELVEVNLRESRDDVYVDLEPDPTSRGPADDIGTALYRLVQLFGTPQVPGFEAGSDISWREDTTFKYLFRLTPGETDDVDRSLPDEWLVTAYDWHTELGVGLAGWSDGDDPAAYGDAVELVTLALVTNIVTDAVPCEYEDKWF